MEKCPHFIVFSQLISLLIIRPKIKSRKTSVCYKLFTTKANIINDFHNF